MQVQVQEEEERRRPGGSGGGRATGGGRRKGRKLDMRAKVLLPGGDGGK